MPGEKVEIRFNVLGKACQLVVTDSAGDGQSSIDAAAKELGRLESKFSSRHPDSLISNINQKAGTGEYCQLDPEALGLFRYVEAIWSESRHLFDPTTCVLSRLYAEASGGQVSTRELAEGLPLVGWSRLEFDEERVRLPIPGMLIDVNPCVRPYALDRVRKLLKKRDVTSALISLDTDVVTIGRQPDGSNWLVGLRHPQGNRTTITRLKLNDKAYAIKGNFENTIRLNGELFGKALSPVDGQPIPGLLAVAVTADNCLEACSAASIARLKTEKEAARWLDNLGLGWMAIDRQRQCIGPLSP